MRTVGIVLAAGQSSRMGFPKALLDLEGTSFLEHLLWAQAEAGILGVFVVTGPHDAVIRARLARVALPQGLAVHVVTNPRPERGQLSSLLAAIDAAEAQPGGAEAVVVTPVDHPRVRAATYRALLTEAATSGAPVTRPRTDRGHGHPVVFAREAFDLLRAAPLDEGARAVVRALGPRVCEVTVPDAGVNDDIDTPEDYRRLQSGA
jgi:CTP:molybdopterin cytidylyltransferase MocA